MNFERGAHYVTFKEGLYFTYFGFVKWLFSSRGGRVAEHIMDHFITVIFVAHLGDDEQRIALARDVILKGCPIDEVQRVLKLHNGGEAIPAIYLWSVGSLRDVIDKLPGAEAVRELITPRGEYPKVFKFGWTSSMGTRGVDYRNEIDGQLPAPISQDFRLVRYDVMRDAKAARDSETDLKNIFLAGKDWNLTVYGKTSTSSGARKEFKEFIVVKAKKDEEALMAYFTQLRMAYGPVEKSEAQKVVDQLLSEKQQLLIKLEHMKELAERDLAAAQKEIETAQQVAQKEVATAQQVAQKEVAAAQEIARKEVEGARREMARLTEQIAMLKEMCMLIANKN